MVDFLGTIVTAALMVVVINALTVYLDIERGAKLALAAVTGLWIGLAAAASASGWLAISIPFPIMGMFVATPLIAAAIATSWSGVRTALLNLPTPLMIGLNFGRVFAVLFFVLASQGRLAGPFPFFAGWGDIITGVVAAPLLFAAAEGKHTVATMAWNLFGTADLILAIFLGVTSAEGSPVQIFTAAPGSAAMQQLPWSFVPTVLVPFWLILHAVIWAQLRRHTRFSHSANAVA
jgi:hypothetical protein